MDFLKVGSLCRVYWTALGGIGGKVLPSFSLPPFRRLWWNLCSFLFFPIFNLLCYYHDLFMCVDHWRYTCSFARIPVLFLPFVFLDSFRPPEINQKRGRDSIQELVWGPWGALKINVMHGSRRRGQASQDCQGTPL